MRRLVVIWGAMIDAIASHRAELQEALKKELVAAESLFVE